MVGDEFENIQYVEVPVNLICASTKDGSLIWEDLEIESILNTLERSGMAQFVLPSIGSKIGGEINNFLEAHSIKTETVFESDIIESLTNSVIDKLGMAFLPIIYVDKELEDATLHSFGPEKGYWKYQICLIAHSKNNDDLLMKSLSLSFHDICHNKLAVW